MAASKMSDACEELLATAQDENHDEFLKLVARNVCIISCYKALLGQLKVDHSNHRKQPKPF